MAGRRYLVLGLPKSGTTALYYAIKRRLPAAALTVYEPQRRQQLAWIQRHPAPALAKVLYPAFDPADTDFSGFDRMVLLVRDPRDLLVSFALYKPLLADRFTDDRLVDAMVALLQAMETGLRPASIDAVLTLLDQHGAGFDVANFFDAAVHRARALIARYPQLHLLRYEDFANRRTEPVSRYLGMSLHEPAELGAHLAYNARARRAGGWTAWFGDADLAALRPSMSRYLDYFGYRDATPHVRAVLDPAHGSLYLKTAVERLKRHPNRFGDLKAVHIYTADYRAHLHSAVSDGAEGAMIELALAALHGRFGEPPNPARYRTWLDQACERGNPDALLHRTIARQAGIGGPAAPAEAALDWANAAAIIGAPRCRSRIARMRHVYYAE